MGWFFGDSTSNHEEAKSNGDSIQQINKPQIYSTFKSYSSSSSCYSDPEDQSYIICNETSNQNGKQMKNTKRIPVNQYQSSHSPAFSSFFPFFSGLYGKKQYSGQFQNTHQLERQIQRDFKQMTDHMGMGPFLFGFNPFLFPHEPIGPKFQTNREHIQERYDPERARQYESKKNNQNKNYYFNSSQRDYQIRDL